MSDIPLAAQKSSIQTVRNAIGSLPTAPARTPSPSNSDEEAEAVPMPGEIAVVPTKKADSNDKDGGADKDVITVFSDPSKFNVKHPLHSTWQLWFDSASKSDKAKSWDEALVKVISFDSIEEFWGSVLRSGRFCEKMHSDDR